MVLLVAERKRKTRSWATPDSNQHQTLSQHGHLSWSNLFLVYSSVSVPLLFFLSVALVFLSAACRLVMARLRECRGGGQALNRHRTTLDNPRVIVFAHFREKWGQMPRRVIYSAAWCWSVKLHTSTERREGGEGAPALLTRTSLASLNHNISLYCDWSNVAVMKRNINQRW